MERMTMIRKMQAYEDRFAAALELLCGNPPPE
jgi:hypothetical protein